MTDPIVRRLPQCERCLNNTRNPHLFCAIHPYGVPQDQAVCLEWEADPYCSEGEWWQPEGGKLLRR